MRGRNVAKDVGEYLATVPPNQRAALERLRRIIRAAAPKATETISYGMPAYKYFGPLVYFAAFKNHCSFFPGSAILKRFRRELGRYQTSKGTIRFTADQPLPTTLVKALIRARMSQNESRRRKTASRKRSKA